MLRRQLLFKPQRCYVQQTCAQLPLITITPLQTQQHRTIIIPHQLKAYGDNFAPTPSQRSDYLLPHRDLHRVSREFSNRASVTSEAKPVATFEEMLVPVQVRSALDELGVAVPSPIQQAAIPTVLKRDTNSVIIASPHGTGKTLAYLVPLFASLIRDRDVLQIPLRENRPRALIFAPTQELVWQIHHVCSVLAKHCGMTALGFTSTRRNNRKWKQMMQRDMPDVLVMGPHAAMRMIETHRLFLDDLRHVVMDEADELISPASQRLGQRFLNKVLRRSLYKHLWPVNTQSIFVTSGLTRELAGYIHRRHGAAVPAVVGQGMHLPVRTSRHRFVRVEREAHKMDALRRILIRGGCYPKSQWDVGVDEDAKNPQEQQENETQQSEGGDDVVQFENVPDQQRSTAQQPSPNDRHCDVVLRWEFQSTKPAPFTNPFAANSHNKNPKRRIIIFFKNIDRCTAIYYKLLGLGFRCTLLHASLPIEVRRENYRKWASDSNNMSENSNNNSDDNPQILCATDLASRGIDVDVQSVVNFDMPLEPAKYLHRAGRTARMGRNGSVDTLFTPRESVIVDAVRNFIRHAVPLEGVHHAQAHMQKPSYPEFRAQRIQSLYKKYVSLISRRIIPAHLEKTFVKHNAMWRPVWHPATSGEHGGVPVRQNERIMDKIMAQAVWYRRLQLAHRKHGSAKFGRKGKEGSHGTNRGPLGIMTVGTSDPQRHALGREQYDGTIVGPPSAPPK